MIFLTIVKGHTVIGEGVEIWNKGVLSYLSFEDLSLFVNRRTDRLNYSSWCVGTHIPQTQLKYKSIRRRL